MIMPRLFLLTVAVVAADAATSRGRHLAGSGSSPPPPPPPPPTSAATPYPTASPTVDAECNAIIAADLDSLLIANASSAEDAFDSDKHGHATYDCALGMLMTHSQFEKAEPYLWCVKEHCSLCPGACPTVTVGLDTAAQCESAVYNLLGFSVRKQTSPNFTLAESYYDQALSLWPQNCGAMQYRTELMLQTKREAEAVATLTRLCTTCGAEAAKSTLAAFGAAGFTAPDDIEACEVVTSINSGAAAFAAGPLVGGALLAVVAALVLPNVAL